MPTHTLLCLNLMLPIYTHALEGHTLTHNETHSSC